MKESFILNFIYILETSQDHSRYKSLREFEMFWLFILSLPEHGMILFKSRNTTFLEEIL